MKIHFVSIGGSVMHQLAIALKKRGDRITGSDDEIFDPARSNLRAAGLLPPEMGWYPDRISKGINAIILGMHARADNPELEKARYLGIPIFSFPEFIYELSKSKNRIAIGGSHGKTTTTAMIMHILRETDFDFDYLVGASLEGFADGVKISDAPIIVLEADEYPASVVERKPKFHFLFPHVAVITGIAWDHINVFPTLENYCSQFSTFIEKIESGGLLIYNEEDEILQRIISESSRADIRFMPYHTPTFQISNGRTVVNDGENKVRLRIFGRHNLLNLQAAMLVCSELGLSHEKILQAMATFPGATGRLQLIFEGESCTVFRDFAHAPSKVKASVEAVKNQFPDRKLIAIMELHTFSSLNEHFVKEYSGALDLADVAIVFYSKHALEMKRLPPLDPEKVSAGFGKNNLVICEDVNELADQMNNLRADQSNFLFMSSGNFEGLKILETLHLK